MYISEAHMLQKDLLSELLRIIVYNSLLQQSSRLLCTHMLATKVTAGVNDLVTSIKTPLIVLIKHLLITSIAHICFRATNTTRLSDDGIINTQDRS